MSADNFRFCESDSLLCYHGPMLYEAKCLKRRKSNDNKAQYFIHYKGWNSKWEEWVDDDRVLAVNTTNMNKMASLKELHSTSKKGVAKRSITVTKEEPIRNSTPPVKGKKRKHSEISESEQIINVSSPSEPKTKKRGRPPKGFTNSKSELTEVNDEIGPSEEIEVVESVKTELKESEKIEEKTEIVEETKAIKGAEANKEKNEKFETKAVKGAEANKEKNENFESKAVKGAEANKEKNEKLESKAVKDAEANNEKLETKAVKGAEANKEKNEKLETKAVKETEANKEKNEKLEKKAVKGAETNKEKLESNKPEDVAIFIVPAPVTKTIPVVNIPPVLKYRIAYDNVMITQNNKVLKFPKIHTTDSLIRAYIHANKESELCQRENAYNFGLALIQYFNLRIHKTLLYQEELNYGLKDKARKCLIKRIKRKSIQLYFKDKLYPSSLLHCIYGPTFLLRLFAELPKLLSSFMKNEKDMAFIVENLDKFLKFVENNYDKYFTENDYKAINKLK